MVFLQSVRMHAMHAYGMTNHSKGVRADHLIYPVGILETFQDFIVTLSL